jgi:hypothetical protein
VIASRSNGILLITNLVPGFQGLFSQTQRVRGPERLQNVVERVSSFGRFDVVEDAVYRRQCLRSRRYVVVPQRVSCSR